MQKYFLTFVLTFACISLDAQNAGDSTFDINKRFSIKELREDLTILKDSLEILHPALYRYTSKHSLDSIFQSSYKRINKPMLLSEFYGIAASLIGKVGDIHSTIELPDEYTNYIAAKSDLFPFDVRIIEDKVFIASNNSSDSTIWIGSRILKINDQPIEDVLNKMKSCFSSEGTNETLKLKRAEQRFAFQYQFVFGYSKQFKLEYVDANKKSKTKIVSAQPVSLIRENRTKNRLQYPQLKPLFPQLPFLTMSLNQGKKTAILTIKWFQNDVLQSSGEQFKTFIDSAFAEIKKTNIKNLVIDIRNNGGGESENASYLYSYLTDRPFRFLYSMETNKRTYEYDKKSGMKYTFIRDSDKYRTSDSSSTFQQFFGLNFQQPHSNNFVGKVYVLIDGLTTSAAPQFASLFKQNNRGKLIGEEAPGALYGGSGRAYSYFYLPNSGLLTMISKYRLFMINPVKKNKDMCIAPDYKTNTTVNDLFNGIDTDLEFALKLIGTNK